MLSATVTLTRLCRVSLIVSCVLWKGQTQSRGQIWLIGWSTHWWTFYMKFYLEILISDFRSDRELLIKVGVAMAKNGNFYGEFGSSEPPLSPYFSVNLAWYWKFEKQMAKIGQSFMENPALTNRHFRHINCPPPLKVLHCSSELFIGIHSYNIMKNVINIIWIWLGRDIDIKIHF